VSKVGFEFLTPVLCVKNVPASLDHYEKVLGFSISWSWSAETAFEQPKHATFACVQRGEISLFLCEQGQGNPGSFISLFVCTLEALDEIFEEYKKSGAKIIEEPTDRIWGMREMWVEDLDGNTFRIGCDIKLL